MPEPAYTAVTEPKTTPLKVTATAENVTYTCPSKDVLFRPTMLFQSRVHKFTVANPTRARLEYHWTLNDVNPLLGPPSSSRGKKGPQPAVSLAGVPFTIEPAQGTIPANGNTTFTVRFAPMEVHDFRFTAAANILLLSPKTEPLVRVDACARREGLGV